MLRLIVCFALSLCLQGCATSLPPTPPPAPPAAEPQPDDAFRTFGGTIIAPGEIHTVRSEPIGVSGLRAMIALGKTEWVIHTQPGGKEDKTATANLVIQRGDGAQSIRVQTGESDAALGVTIKVIEAGEVYQESSMRWVPFAKITVTETP
ncbi:MAG: hypothetical protein ACPGU1_12325 [Myxococcota bacterium]